jgi:hypothetical protein
MKSTIMTTEATNQETEESQESQGIVIRIKPRTIARYISVGLEFVIQALILLKTTLDEHVRDNEDDDDSAPVYEPVPVINGDDKDEVEDEEVVKEEVVEGIAVETESLVDWTRVEKSIQEGVESVDWDRVGASIKTGVESVDWDRVGRKMEEWSKNVDWDKVGKSISDAFEQCNSDENKK